MASIAAIVSNENRTVTNVRQYVWTMPPMFTFMTRPAMIEARRIPLPVADSHENAYTAPSGLASGGATGGTRWIMLCRPSIGNCGFEMLLSHVLTVGNPHANTTTQRMIHGSHAESTSALLCV